MNIEGHLVRFILSTEGKRALKGLVPVKGPFEAFVLELNSLGPLILAGPLKREQAGGGQRAMLLRWNYISTVIFDYRVPQSSPRVPIGFGRA